MVDNGKRIDELKKELARDFRSRQFYQLGELLRRDGRLNEAADVLRGGLKHHVRYVAAWVALGRTCLDLGHGRESEAADALTQALGLDAQNPVAWRLLGEARLACGQRGAALEALERALALVPGDDVLKAAVEALQAEVELPVQPAPLVERRSGASFWPEPREKPAPMQPESSEAPFAFEAAPLEIEPVLRPPEVLPPVSEEEVTAPSAEPFTVPQLGSPTAEAEETAPAGTFQDGDLLIEGPFGAEPVPTELSSPSLAEEPVPVEAAPPAGGFDVFDVFGEASAPVFEPTEAVVPEVVSPPVEPLAEAWEKEPSVSWVPEQAAGLELPPPIQPEADRLQVEPLVSEVAGVEATGAEPAPELEPAPAVFAATGPQVQTAEAVVQAGELQEAVPESVLVPEEVPIETMGDAPEPGPPDEEAQPVAPGGELLARPEMAAEAVGEAEPAVLQAEPEGLGTVPAMQLSAEPEIREDVGVPVAPVEDEEPPASIALARLFLRQQQMDLAVEVLERLLRREPDNQEAHDLLLLVRDMMEEAPVQPVPALSAGERKIAALQRWLVRMEQGRERMAP